MCGTKNFAKSLTELVNDVDSTIPHAKQNGSLVELKKLQDELG